MENWQKQIAEVKNDYTDEDNYTHIDVFFTDDEMEEGTTVAVVCQDTGKTVFFDQMFRTAPEVQAAIKEARPSNYKRLEAVLGEKTMEEWQKDWETLSNDTRLPKTEATFTDRVNASPHAATMADFEWTNTRMGASMCVAIERVVTQLCKERHS